MKKEPLEVITITFSSLFGNEDYALGLFDSIHEQNRYEIHEPKKVRYAIQELCMNAIQHGNKYDKNKFVEVTFEMYSEQIIIYIKDKGKNFNIQEFTTPTIQERINKQVDVGWGITLIKNMVKQIESLQSEDGNIIKLTIRSKYNESK